VAEPSLRRVPRPSLRPFIEEVWLAGRDESQAMASREINLPDGRMHLVFRISENPVLLFDHVDSEAPRDFGGAVVGGARTSFYVRDISLAAISIGARLRPGAARILLGIPAGEFAERHTRLDDLWGRGADQARDRLQSAGTAHAMLDTFEAILAQRLPRIRALHPAVAMALGRIGGGERVEAVVQASGYSHRRFIALFEESVGLTPKRYARVRRFDRALRHWNANLPSRWIDVALEGGYSDQSHFAREFLAFAGLTPEQYRRAAPIHTHHVPQVNFVQDARRRGS
jgi:AraC-like DNA-binding protein